MPRSWPLIHPPGTARHTPGLSTTLWRGSPGTGRGDGTSCRALGSSPGASPKPRSSPGPCSQPPPLPRAKGTQHSSAEGWPWHPQPFVGTETFAPVLSPAPGCPQMCLMVPWGPHQPWCRRFPPQVPSQPSQPPARPPAGPRPRRAGGRAGAGAPWSGLGQEAAGGKSPATGLRLLLTSCTVCFHPQARKTATVTPNPPDMQTSRYQNHASRTWNIFTDRSKTRWERSASDINSQH